MFSVSKGRRGLSSLCREGGVGRGGTHPFQFSLDALQALALEGSHGADKGKGIDKGA